MTEQLAELRRFDQGLHLSHCCVEAATEPTLQGDNLHHGCTTSCRICLRCVWDSIEQARAEVLAACIKTATQIQSSRWLAASKNGCQLIVDALKRLQPAAKALEEHDKRIRAEVLATCGERIDLFMENIGNYSDEFGKKRPFKTWDRDDWEAAALRLLSDVQDALDKLQPTASALEEYVKNLPLSEIARIKGIPGVAKLGKTYDRPDFNCAEDE